MGTEKYVPSCGTAFAGGGDAFLERTRERKRVTPSSVPPAAAGIMRRPGVLAVLGGLSLWVSGDGQRRLPALDGLVSVAD